MSQTPYELDLRDLMDAHYGAGNWVYRTGPNTGTDIGPALQDGINQLKAGPNQSGIIKIGPFNWALQTSGIDFAGIVVEGVTSVRSCVVFQNANGQAFSFKGSSGGGMRHVAIMLETGLGNTNSIALFGYGNSVTQPDQTFFEDLYITSVGGTSFWYDGVHFDGELRTSPGGIRVVTWKDIIVFDCHNVGFMLLSCYQHNLERVSCNIGVANSALYIGGTPAVPSYDIKGVGINAAITVYSASNVWFDGKQWA